MGFACYNLLLIKEHLKKIFINILIGLFRVLSVMKGVFGFIIKPLQMVGRFFLRIFFYKFIVSGYKLYILVINRLGWSHFKKKGIFFVFIQKPLHITAAILTSLLVFNNAIVKTHAETMMYDVNKTILAELINSEFSSIEEEQLIEEFFDQESIISSLQQTYLDNLTAVKSLPIVDMNAIDVDGSEDGVPIGVEDDDGDDVVEREPSAPIAKRSKIVEYKVQSGDTVSTIARKFEVSVSTILWENSLNSYSIIRPGDTLSILPESGISYKIGRGDTLSRISQLFNIDESVIMKANGMSNANKISIGQKILVPGATTEYVARVSSKYSGIQALKDIVKPDSAKVRAGIKMQWPATCRRLTQYFSWRHKGLDVACPLGTSLYAADSGVVEVAGWGRGYGNQVLINHGGGKKTRYAHASKLYVKKGERVSKGETIAAMGSTGWSTGSHIHFEVIINGVKYNPLNYIK